MIWPFKKTEPQPQYSPYDAGQQAYRDGKEFWENPHVDPSDAVTYGMKWLGGWCYAKQIAERS